MPGRHLFRQLEDAQGFLALIVCERDRTYTPFPLQPGQPLLGDDRVGQVSLVKHLDQRGIATQRRHQWILTTEGNPGVHHLDDEVHLGHDFLDLLSGLVHMPGKPVNGHGVYSAD